jgi:cyclase
MKPLTMFLLIAGATIGAGVGVRAQQSLPSVGNLDVLRIRPNFYLVAGAGGNIAVQIGEDGVVLVNAGSADKAATVIAEIKRLTPRPIRYIIDTSADADMVGGNDKIAAAGQSLFTSGNLGPGGAGGNSIINNGGAASIVATENVLTRMSAPTGKQSPYPAEAWPTETYTRKQKVMFLNGEGIEVLAAPAAHSDGDSIVFFRRSDVIATGDIFDLTHFPTIQVDQGGTIEGEIDALNRLIDLAIPSVPLPWKTGGTIVIPGHGRLAEQAELVEYRDMLTIVRDRVADLLKSKKTLDQIKAATPTEGWNARYGAAEGTALVEAIYTNLTSKAHMADASQSRTPGTR